MGVSYFNTSPTPDEEPRRCPHCGSDDVHFVQRGYAGLTDAAHQFVACNACDKKTYEILSRTERDLRIERLEPGTQFRFEGADYRVKRILRVGLNELLVYVDPVVKSTQYSGD